MLLPIERIVGSPVLSLQTGAGLARVSSPIIDPRNLTIAALYVTGPRLSDPVSVIHPEDIREVSDIGLIVDDDSSLMSLDGLVRLKEIIDFGFELQGIRVETEQGKVLGKVHNYSINPDDFSVQQLYTKPTLFRSITSTHLIIRRSQIRSINNSRIVVESPTIKERSAEKPVQTPAFVNPFRSAPPVRQQSDGASD